jgi:hypothetical protein
MLDAPVSGGDVGAREATLSIMVGGEAQALERALAALGARITHVGASGAGQVVKACNQVVVALALALEALGEALVLGTKAGVDPAAIVEALGGGLAASRVLEVRGPKLLARDFEPGFKLDLHAKDLAIVLATARSSGSPGMRSPGSPRHETDADAPPSDMRPVHWGARRCSSRTRTMNVPGASSTGADPRRGVCSINQIKRLTWRAGRVSVPLAIG